MLDIHQGIIYSKFRPKNLISLCDRKNSPEGCHSNLLGKGPFDVGHLDREKADEILKVCGRHKNVLTGELGRTDKLTYDITLLDNRPVKAHPYQLAPSPQMEPMRGITDTLVKDCLLYTSRCV